MEASSGSVRPEFIDGHLDLRQRDMIVCICKNVNTAQIVDSIRSGADSVEAVRAETGASSGCGKCQFQVNRLIQDVAAESTTPLFYNAVQSA